MAGSLTLFILLGAIFGLLAGASAYVISYEEYKKHFLGGKEPFKIAFRMAIVAFFFFFGLSVVVGYILVKKVF